MNHRQRFLLDLWAMLRRPCRAAFYLRAILAHLGELSREHRLNRLRQLHNH